MSKESTGRHGIPFGWHVTSQRMVTAHDVGNGRSCGCVCIACGARLQARQGEIRIWHFAHDSETNCKHATEAAIHYMAKQMIAERGAIYLPHRERTRVIHGKQGVWSENIRADVQSPGLHLLENCQIEPAVFAPAGQGRMFRPDLLAQLDGYPLAIEVLNTHAVEPEKSLWMEEQGYCVLEIDVHDLGFLPQDQILRALEIRLFETAGNSSWLCHVGDLAANTILQELEEQVRARKREVEGAQLARIEAEESARKGREAFLRRVRDVAALKIRISRCTVRIGRNSERVSLKVFGAAPDAVFEAVKSLGREHRGHFNRKAKCWEFFRFAETESFYDELCQTVPLRLVGSLQVSTAAVQDSISEKGTAPLPEPQVHVFFEDPALQEAFDERAAVLEFDAGYKRQIAEQIAFALVQDRKCARDSLIDS